MNKLLKYIVRNDPTMVTQILSILLVTVISYFKIKKRNRHNYKLLNYKEFDNKKIFFILGSGRSINYINNKQFSVIKSNFAIGVNRWVLHDFIPNCYSFERSEDKDTIRIFNNFFSSDTISNYKPMILFNQSVIDRKGKLFYNITKDHDDLIRIYTTLRIPAWNRKNFERLLGVLLKPSILKLIPNGVLLGKRASIERMTYLAIKAGFNKIVYLGVDLNHTNYFWEDNEDIVKKFNLTNYKSGQNENIHKTDLPQNSIPVSDIIKIISNNVHNRGVQLYVGNKDSKLAEFLPLYKWD